MQLFMKKYLPIFLGSLSLCLGVIGIFIPLLPTTPLLLLAAYFYLRSSAKLYKWLINHRILGLYIYNYIHYKAVSRSTKIATFVFLWISLAISAILIEILYVRILLFLVGTGVSIHLFTLKSIKNETFLKSASYKDNEKETAAGK